jgi:hypothetical protein
MSDTISTLAAKLRPHWLRDLSSNITAVSAAGTPGVTDHGALSGLFDDDHPQYLTAVRGDARYLPTGVGAAYQYMGTGSGTTGAWRDVSEFAGNGLASATGVLAVGAGAGITVNADDVALTTPGTLSVASGNGSAGSHTHAITSSAAPGAAASLLATTAAGLLTLQNGAFVQAAASSTAFVSGFAGSGWRVDYGITTASKASAEFDDLTIRGRMRVYELLIQQIRATNGSVFVSSASKVVAVASDINPLWTFNGVQATLNGSNATLTVAYYTIDTAVDKDNDSGTDRDLYHGFLYGDIIRAQQVRWNGSIFTGLIQSNMEVTAILSLTQYQAALVSGDAPAVGYDYVRFGNSVDTTRRGAIYLTADDAAAPFIDIVDDIVSHDDWNTPGKIKARLGKLTGISDVDFGGALSGYGLYSQNVYLKGAIWATSGQFTGTVYANAGVFQGTISAASGTVGGWAIGATSLTAGSSTTTVGIDSGGTNPAIYAGSATPGSAPFRVTNAGALTATDATVTGQLIASSGGISGNFYVGSDVGASGNLYVGSNADMRFSADGIRCILPTDTSPNIPTASQAIRWFPSGTGTWADTISYAGLVTYKNTSTTPDVMDLNLTSCVGSADNTGGYSARVVLQAGHYSGHTYTDANIVVTREAGAGGRFVDVACDTMYTSNNVYVTGEMSAQVVVDRTPHFAGDAVAELRGIKGNKGGGIDHSTLPTFARKTIRRRDAQVEEGRDLGAMISILTVAVQQLDTRLDALEGNRNGN